MSESCLSYQSECCVVVACLEVVSCKYLQVKQKYKYFIKWEEKERQTKALHNESWSFFGIACSTFHKYRIGPNWGGPPRSCCCGPTQRKGASIPWLWVSSQGSFLGSVAMCSIFSWLDWTAWVLALEGWLQIAVSKKFVKIYICKDISNKYSWHWIYQFGGKSS